MSLPRSPSRRILCGSSRRCRSCGVGPHFGYPPRIKKRRTETQLPDPAQVAPLAGASYGDRETKWTADLSVADVDDTTQVILKHRVTWRQPVALRRRRAAIGSVHPPRPVAAPGSGACAVLSRPSENGPVVSHVNPVRTRNGVFGLIRGRRRLTLPVPAYACSRSRIF